MAGSVHNQPLLCDLPGLGVSRPEAERSSLACLRPAVQLDLSKLLFVTLDVLLNGVGQKLHMRRGHDDARVNGGFGSAGNHAGKIDKELGGAVGNQGEVGIDSLRQVFRPVGR